MTKTAFLSYEKTYLDDVKRIEAYLSEHDVDTWVDYRDVKPGMPWRKTIFDNITKSDAMVVFLSTKFIESEFNRQELYVGKSFRKRLIPVLLEPCTDALTQFDEVRHMQDLYMIDLTGVAPDGDAFDEKMKKLVEAIDPPVEPVPLNSELIYISHAPADRDFAEKLGADLKFARGNVWVDTLNLRGGDDWRQAMADAVMKADHLIVCLSPDAAESEWVRKEVLLATTRDIPMIPVIPERVATDEDKLSSLPKLLDGTFEMRLLGDINWIFPRPDYDALLSQLTEAFDLHMPQVDRRHGIFVSYRRSDSIDITGRIYDRMVGRFGKDGVFKDVNNIPAGVNFVDFLQKTLGEAAVTLVIIGPDWASIKKVDGSKRLDDVDDFVRIEVETALNADNMLVIPVLVGGATMPEENELPKALHDLRMRNAFTLKPDPDFHPGMDKLIEEIEKSQQTAN